MDDIWTYVISVATLFVGWFLGELTRWLSNRGEDKKAARRVLYHLLEIHYQLKRWSGVLLPEPQFESLLAGLPQEFQDGAGKEQVKQVM